MVYNFSNSNISDSNMADLRLNFNIPKRKQIENKEILVDIDINSRDAQDILQTVRHSYIDPRYSCVWKVSSVTTINNKRLDQQYREKKQSMKSEGRNNKELQDRYLFLASSSKIQDIGSRGLSTGQDFVGWLGNSNSGVYISRHADIQIEHGTSFVSPTFQLYVFKVMLGKGKSVVPTHAKQMCNLEPTPNYDCHISIHQAQSSSSSYERFIRSMVYLYEYDDEALPRTHPRHCLPIAVITYMKPPNAISNKPKFLCTRNIQQPPCPPSTVNNKNSLSLKPKLSLQPRDRAPLIQPAQRPLISQPSQHAPRMSYAAWKAGCYTPPNVRPFARLPHPMGDNNIRASGLPRDPRSIARSGIPKRQSEEVCRPNHPPNLSPVLSSQDHTLSDVHRNAHMAIQLDKAISTSVDGNMDIDDTNDDGNHLLSIVTNYKKDAYDLLATTKPVVNTPKKDEKLINDAVNIEEQQFVCVEKSNPVPSSENAFDTEGSQGKEVHPHSSHSTLMSATPESGENAAELSPTSMESASVGSSPSSADGISHSASRVCNKQSVVDVHNQLETLIQSLVQNLKQIQEVPTIDNTPIVEESLSTPISADGEKSMPSPDHAGSEKGNGNVISSQVTKLNEFESSELGPKSVGGITIAKLESCGFDAPGSASVNVNSTTAFNSSLNQLQTIGSDAPTQPVVEDYETSGNESASAWTSGDKAIIANLPEVCKDIDASIVEGTKRVSKRNMASNIQNECPATQVLPKSSSALDIIDNSHAQIHPKSTSASTVQRIEDSVKKINLSKATQYADLAQSSRSESPATVVGMYPTVNEEKLMKAWEDTDLTMNSERRKSPLPVQSSNDERLMEIWGKTLLGDDYVLDEDLMDIIKESEKVVEQEEEIHKESNKGREEDETVLVEQNKSAIMEDVDVSESGKERNTSNIKNNNNKAVKNVFEFLKINATSEILDSVDKSEQPPVVNGCLVNSLCNINDQEEYEPDLYDPWSVSCDSSDEEVTSTVRAGLYQGSDVIVISDSESEMEGDVTKSELQLEDCKQDDSKATIARSGPSQQSDEKLHEMPLKDSHIGVVNKPHRQPILELVAREVLTLQQTTPAPQLHKLHNNVNEEDKPCGGQCNNPDSTIAVKDSIESLNIHKEFDMSLLCEVKKEQTDEKACQELNDLSFVRNGGNKNNTEQTLPMDKKLIVADAVLDVNIESVNANVEKSTTIHDAQDKEFTGINDDKNIDRSQETDLKESTEQTESVSSNKLISTEEESEPSTTEQKYTSDIDYRSQDTTYRPFQALPKASASQKKDIEFVDIDERGVFDYNHNTERFNTTYRSDVSRTWEDIDYRAFRREYRPEYLEDTRITRDLDYRQMWREQHVPSAMRFYERSSGSMYVDQLGYRYKFRHDDVGGMHTRQEYERYRSIYSMDVDAYDGDLRMKNNCQNRQVYKGPNSCRDFALGHDSDDEDSNKRRYRSQRDFYAEMAQDGNLDSLFPNRRGLANTGDWPVVRHIDEDVGNKSLDDFRQARIFQRESEGFNFSGGSVSNYQRYGMQRRVMRDHDLRDRDLREHDLRDHDLRYADYVGSCDRNGPSNKDKLPADLNVARDDRKQDLICFMCHRNNINCDCYHDSYVNKYDESFETQIFDHSDKQPPITPMTDSLGESTATLQDKQYQLDMPGEITNAIISNYSQRGLLDDLPTRANLDFNQFQDRPEPIRSPDNIPTGYKLSETDFDKIKRALGSISAISDVNDSNMSGKTNCSSQFEKRNICSVDRASELREIINGTCKRNTDDQTCSVDAIEKDRNVIDHSMDETCKSKYSKKCAIETANEWIESMKKVSKHSENSLTLVDMFDNIFSTDCGGLDTLKSHLKKLEESSKTEEAPVDIEKLKESEADSSTDMNVSQIENQDLDKLTAVNDLNIEEGELTDSSDNLANTAVDSNGKHAKTNKLPFVTMDALSNDNSNTCVDVISSTNDNVNVLEEAQESNGVKNLEKIDECFADILRHPKNANTKMSKNDVLQYFQDKLEPRPSSSMHVSDNLGKEHVAGVNKLESIDTKVDTAGANGTTSEKGGVISVTVNKSDKKRNIQIDACKSDANVTSSTITIDASQKAMAECSISQVERSSNINQKSVDKVSHKSRSYSRSSSTRKKRKRMRYSPCKRQSTYRSRSSSLSISSDSSSSDEYIPQKSKRICKSRSRTRDYSVALSLSPDTSSSSKSQSSLKHQRKYSKKSIDPRKDTETESHDKNSINILDEVRKKLINEIQELESSDSPPMSQGCNVAVNKSPSMLVDRVSSTSDAIPKAKTTPAVIEENSVTDKSDISKSFDGLFAQLNCTPYTKLQVASNTEKPLYRDREYYPFTIGNQWKDVIESTATEPIEIIKGDSINDVKPTTVKDTFMNECSDVLLHIKKRKEHEMRETEMSLLNKPLHVWIRHHCGTNTEVYEELMKLTAYRGFYRGEIYNQLSKARRSRFRSIVLGHLNSSFPHQNQNQEAEASRDGNAELSHVDLKSMSAESINVGTMKDDKKIDVPLTEVQVQLRKADEGIQELRTVLYSIQQNFNAANDQWHLTTNKIMKDLYDKFKSFIEIFVANNIPTDSLEKCCTCMSLALEYVADRHKPNFSASIKNLSSSCYAIKTSLQAISKHALSRQVSDNPRVKKVKVDEHLPHEGLLAEKSKLIAQIRAWMNSSELQDIHGRVHEKVPNCLLLKDELPNNRTRGGNALYLMKEIPQDIANRLATLRTSIMHLDSMTVHIRSIPPTATTKEHLEFLARQSSQMISRREDLLMDYTHGPYNEKRAAQLKNELVILTEASDAANFTSVSLKERFREYVKTRLLSLLRHIDVCCTEMLKT